MILAALHVHSTYSDGEFTLAELRAKFIAAGCSLVCMADHADAFDEEKVQRYRAELALLSDEKLRFLPGLEFGCVQRMHIVGYGVTALIDSDDPQEVITHIRANDGVPMIAHPPDALFPLIESFSVLPDGIEAWNSKYDGRYAPRPATFDLVRRLQQRQPSLRAFFGQDLHWRKQFAGLFTRFDIQSRERDVVLSAMRAGQFVGVKEGIVLTSDAVLPDALRREFGLVNARSQRFRSTVKRVKSLLGGTVKHLPAPVKAQLRRFF